MCHQGLSMTCVFCDYRTDTEETPKKSPREHRLPFLHKDKGEKNEADEHT